MKKSKYSSILDTILDEKVSKDHQLAPEILARLQKNKGANMSKRMKVLVPTVVVLVMMVAVIFTVPAVAQAVQRWLGYVPGFGLVSDGSVRMIDQPVQVIQDGITLTVTEVTSSSKKTEIKFNLQPIPADAKDETKSCKFPDNGPILVLSDGTKPILQAVGWEANKDTYFSDVTFDGIPANINEMALKLNCVQQTLPGSIPWDWTVPLSFDPQKLALTMAPVIEVPTATEKSGAENTKISTSLDVKQIIPLADGYILSGSMSVDPVSGLTVDESDGYLEDISIKDANNQALIPSRVPDDFIIEGNNGANDQFNWAIQVSGKNIAWPLTVTVNSVIAITDPYPMSIIKVDVGDNPQPEKVWTIDKDVALGPKTVHVVSLKRLKDKYGFDGYELTLIFDPSLELNFEIAGASPNGGGGSGGEKAGDQYTHARSYVGHVPTGLLTLEFTGHGNVNIDGPWQVSVEKPAAQ
jgi:hypothetical protein